MKEPNPRKYSLPYHLVRTRHDNAKGLKLSEGLKKLRESPGILLERGRTYRAKKPQSVGGVVNDRTIVFMDRDGTIEYTGRTLTRGGKNPTITIHEFLSWAAKDVTDES